jgi:hypothetical protein
MNTTTTILGRPATVSVTIKNNLVLFPTLTNKELVSHFIDNQEIRSMMKGGLDGDIEKQKKSLYVTVRKIREEGGLEFNGRENAKGEMKMKWVRATSNVNA